MHLPEKCFANSLKVLLFSQAYYKYNRISFRVPITSLSRNLSFIKSEFCTSASKTVEYDKKPFSTAAVYNVGSETEVPNYYKDYIMSKPEVYSLVRDAELIKMEFVNYQDSFTLITDALNKLEKGADQQIKDLAAKFSDYSVNEICGIIIFTYEKIFKESKSANSQEFISCLFKEIHNKQLSLDELFKTLILTKWVNCSKINYYKIKVVLKLFKRIERLTPPEVVQLFFNVFKLNLLRVPHKFSVLLYLNKNISQFNIVELGIIIKGIATFGFIISNRNIVNAIFNKIIEEIGNINDEILQRMIKDLHVVCKSSDLEFLPEFQKEILPYVSKFSIPCLLDIASLGSIRGCINYDFLETVSKIFKENINELSLFSVYRIIKYLIFYDFEDEELLMLALKKFERSENIQQDLKTLVYFLSELTHCRLYPKNLLDLVLSEQFISENITSSGSCKKLKASWWILYCNLDVEKPEYLNVTFKSKDRSKLYFETQFFLKNSKFGYLNTNFSGSINHIIKSLSNIYGENAVVKSVCLPQYENGVVIRLNKNLEPQPIPESFYYRNISYIKRPQDNDHYWIFLNVLSNNQYLQKYSKTVRHRQTQSRQLKGLGYIPIMVPRQLYYDNLKQNTQETFISDLIQKSLEKKNDHSFV